MNATGSPQGEKKKKKTHTEEDNTLVEDVVEDVVEEVAAPVLELALGCLIRPVTWIVTMPIRLVLKVIEAIFD